jgi:dTDP-L-rhamnose 4-epimerase
MKALVAGGAGFIGSHLVDALIAENHEVVVLDSLEPRVHGAGAMVTPRDGVQFLQEDTRDKAAWEKALAGVAVVFHEAAYQDYMPDYSRFFHTNVVGTALMYEVIRERKLPVQKVVVASSQAVYGEGQYECPAHGRVMPAARSRSQMARGDWELQCPSCHERLRPKLLEESFPNPTNHYGLSKYAQELAALRLGQMLEIPTVALRYSITQGPRQSLFNHYSGICRIFTSRLRRGLTPIVYEDGLQTRDFVHISDVVDANMLALRDERANFQAFNVGSGIAMTVQSYAEQLCEAINPRLKPVIPGEYRVGDTRNSVSSIEKLKALGWQPKKTLKDIINDFLAWVDAIGHIPEEAFRADQVMRNSGVVRRVGATG